MFRIFIDEKCTNNNFSYRINPEGVDLVLDCLSGENTNKGISLTKPLGKYVIYGKDICILNVFCALCIFIK